MKKAAAEIHNFEIIFMKRLVFILILFSGYYVLPGQIKNIDPDAGNECLSKVKEADRLFQDGLYDKCIDLLEVVLKSCSLTRSEKVLALELAAKAYLETDDPEKAESAVNLMLKTYPHYELKEQDNSESFNRLVKKYNVHPRFSVGIRNTADWVSFKTTKIYSVLDGLDYSESYNQKLEGILTGFGLMYYGWAEYEFDRDISLNADLIFKWTKFNRNFTKASTFDLSFSETDNFIEIPLYLKKYFHPGKNMLTYLTAGMGWMHMTKANANVSIYYTNIDSTASAGNINMLEMRNRNTFEWVAGAGIGYKVKNLRLFIDIRYYGGMNSFTNPNKGLKNSMLINDYFYIDNSVKLNQFEIGASVSYTFINSVKRIGK
jgi:hypothetical protein